MRRWFLVFAMCLIAQSVFSQFHVEVGATGSLPQGDFGKAYTPGLGGYVEPKYALSDQVDLGLNVQMNGFGAKKNNSLPNATLLSVLPAAYYRFGGENVIPVVGLGLGMYRFSSDEASGLDSGLNSTEFGFAPKVGAHIGRISVGAAYHIVSDANFLQFHVGVRLMSRE